MLNPKNYNLEQSIRMLQFLYTMGLWETYFFKYPQAWLVAREDKNKKIEERTKSWGRYFGV